MFTLYKSEICRLNSQEDTSQFIILLSASNFWSIFILEFMWLLLTFQDYTYQNQKMRLMRWEETAVKYEFVWNEIEFKGRKIMI